MWTIVSQKADNFSSLDKIDYQFDKGCSLVKASNLDDDGQESNGGGKTSFVDIVPVCLLGASLTGRDIKDCVNWHSNQNHFYAEITMKNTSGDECFISRTVYNNYKSAELVILVNGKVPSELPTKSGVENAVDVKAGNAYILEEILDIKREDLLNYYLISDQYTPFMVASNTKKTEVISRFSKSDKIDNVISAISSDVSEEEDAIMGQKNRLDVLNSQLEFYSSEVDDDKKVKFEDDKASKIAEIDSDIESIEEDIDSCNESISTLTDELSVMENELRDMNSPKVTGDSVEIPMLEEQILDKQGKVTALRGESFTSSKRLSDLNEELSESNKTISIIEQRIHDANSAKNYLNAIIDGAIQCPKCNHKFKIGEDITVAEAEVKVVEVADIISSLNSELKEEKSLNLEVKDDINNEKSRLEELSISNRKKIKFIQSEIESIQDKIDEIRAEENEIRYAIRSKETEIKNHKSNIDFYSSKIEKLKNRLEEERQYRTEVKSKKFDTSNIDRKVSECKEEISSIEKDISAAESSLNMKKQWAANFSNFKYYLANIPIKAICGHVNYFLENQGSDLMVNIEGFKVLKSGKIKSELNPLIYRGGTNPQSYKSFSGGERVRINIASDLAFQEIINSSSKTGGLNHYQNDELLNALDSAGIQNAAKALNKLDKNIMLVTHSGADLNYQKTVNLVKENGKTSVK